MPDPTHVPASMRVLAAEADAARRIELRFTLAGDAIPTTFVATAGEAAARLAVPGAFAAAIVALDLPDGDGVALIERLRGAGLRIPLLLTADLPSPEPVARALEAGASEVIAWPFRPTVLRARLRTLLRAAAAEPGAALGRYRFDNGTRTLHHPQPGRVTRLTEKEAALLHYLHRAGGRPVPREELLREVWRYAPNASSHTVATHIHRLRRKVEVEAGGPCLFARDWRGYRLAPAWPGEPGFAPESATNANQPGAD